MNYRSHLFFITGSLLLSLFFQDSAQASEVKRRSFHKSVVPENVIKISSSKALDPDDTCGLHPALSALPDTGGTIQIASQTTCILGPNKSLNITKPNVTLKGTDWTSVIKNGNNAQAGYLIYVHSGGTGFRLKNLKLDGNRVNNNAMNHDSSAVVLASVTNVELDGVEISEVERIGMQIANSSSNIKILNSYFHDIGGIKKDGDAGIGVWAGFTSGVARPYDILIQNSLFKNIHNNVGNAGDSVALGLDAEHVRVKSNMFLNNYNRSGGQFANFGPGHMPLVWQVTENIIKRTKEGPAADNTAGFEFAASSMVFARNHLFSNKQINCGVVIEPQGPVLDSIRVYSNIVRGYYFGVCSLDLNGGYAVDTRVFNNYISDTVNAYYAGSPNSLVDFQYNSLYSNVATINDASYRNTMANNTALNSPPYGAWASPALGAGVSGAVNSARDSFGHLTFLGYVTLSTNAVGTVAFYLPVDHRPLKNQTFWTYEETNRTACQLEARPNGEVVVKSATCQGGNWQLGDSSFWLVEDPLSSGFPAGKPVITKMGPGCNGSCLWAQGADLCLDDSVTALTLVNKSWQLLGHPTATCFYGGTGINAPIPAGMIGNNDEGFLTISNSKDYHTYYISYYGFIR